MNKTARLLLWCAATDSSFTLARLGDRSVLTGKCIHCGRKLAISLEGVALTHATVEHIIPRTHGGTDAIENLAIACSRCNQGKGARLDPRRWEDEALQRVIATLQARRAERMRAPLAGIDLPAQPGPNTEGAEATEAKPDDETPSRPGGKTRSRAASRQRRGRS